MERWKQTLSGTVRAGIAAGISLGMTGIMLFETAAPAWAASPEFARTTEEWQKLKDNTLEYDEIEALVHEYNPTVQNNEYSYRKFLKDYGKTNQKVSDAYQKAADQAEESITGNDDAGSVIADMQTQLQVDELRKQADETLEDGQIQFLTYEQAEKNIVMEAQSNMITYFIRELETIQKKSELETAVEELNLLQVQRSAGVVTDFEVLAGQEAVQTAQESVHTAERSASEVKETLLTTLGWSHLDHPDMGGLPELDEFWLDTMNPEQDLSHAVENNYAHRIHLQKKKNARSSETIEDLECTIRNQETQIAVALSDACRKVSAAKAAWIQSVKAQEQNQEALRLGELQLQAGTITGTQYHKLKTACADSERQIRIEKLTLLQAVEAYRWVVKGLAAVG